MLIDLNETYSGHLMRDFTPPIQPPKEINDPDDRKPPELVAKSFKADASKFSNVWTETGGEPGHADQKQSNADRDAKKSDDEKLSHLESMLSRPSWQPRKIPNPNYYKVGNVFDLLAPISAIGLELWSLNDRIHFDNFLIVDDERLAHQFALNSWTLKHNLELYREPSVSF